MAAGALDGLRVLDFGGSISAAYAGVLFAAAGAQVVKVEPPECGDDIRRLPPFSPAETPPESSAMQTFLDAGKQSLALDLTTPEGCKTAARLCAQADVVIEARDPGFVNSIGIDPTAPPCVVLSLSWFGRTGPGRDHTGSDAVILSRTGFVHQVGPIDGPPIVPGGYYAQIVAGLSGFVPAMATCIGRLAGGPGCMIDLSVYEANMAFTEQASVRNAFEGYEPQRTGINRFQPVHPQTLYPAADGWIGVTTLTPPQWTSLCELLGLHDLGADPRFRSAYDRSDIADTVDALLIPELKKRKVMDLFLEGQKRRIPLAPVPRMDELAGLDHFRARGVFGRYAHGEDYSFDAPVIPWKMEKTPLHSGGIAPRLGAQSQEVLADYGFQKDEIADLVKTGTIVPAKEQS